MALSNPSLLDTTTSASALSSLNSGSFTPTANALLIVCARIADTSQAMVLTASIADTFTGTGSWAQYTVLINTSDSAVDALRCSIFVAQLGSSPGSGYITVSIASPDTPSRWVFHTIEVTGYNTSTPVPQNASNKDVNPSASPLTVTLGGTPASDSMVLGSVYGQAVANHTPGTGFTELAETSTGSGGGLFRGQVQYDKDSADTTCDWSWATTTDDILGVAIEIAAAAGGAISGSTAGAATVSGTLKGAGDIDGSSAGVGTTTATIKGSGSLSGTATAVASASGAIAGTGTLSGTSAGVAAATGELKGDGALTGTSTGVATVTGTMEQPAGDLEGASAGVATVAGMLTGTGTLAGTSAGIATATGSITGAGALRGLMAGVATTTATIAATGTLAGTSAGVATATATLAGIGALSGLAAGSATVSGMLELPAGEMVGWAAGVATVTSTLSGAGVLVGTSTGATTATGTLTGAGTLAGAFAGVATTTATLTGIGHLTGVSIGQTIANGTLTGTGGEHPAHRLIVLPGRGDDYSMSARDSTITLPGRRSTYGS